MAAIVAALLAASQCAALAPQPTEDVMQLVKQLPTNGASSPYDQKLPAKIAALGAEALPALKNELRLGIRFKELNTILNEHQSRRAAVVDVLSRMLEAESGDLLVRTLSDPPDNYGMQVAALVALSKRTLSSSQIQALLANSEPEIVLAGVKHAAGKLADPDLKAAVARIFDARVAAEQFKNEYGASTASLDALWNVRFAAGQALNIDLTPEIQARAKQILAELRRESLHPTQPDVPQFISNGSRAENIILENLNQLAALGRTATDLVESMAASADGDFAKILDQARARLGDRTRLAAVTDSLVSADSHTVRFCAASTLRIIGDPAAIPALRKALRDPYRRRSGSDVGPPQQVFPVREIAADALIDLGADSKEVRAAMRE